MFISPLHNINTEHSQVMVHSNVTLKYVSLSIAICQVEPITCIMSLNLNKDQ